MRNLFLVVVVLMWCPLAYGEPLAAVAGRSDATAEAPRFAVAVNGPHSWASGAVGASVYMRLGDHVALRGNFASYEYASVREIIGVFAGDGGTGYGGRLLDLGVGAMWFPRRAWHGPFIEAGLLRRARDTSLQPDLDDSTDTRSTEYAGRAMVGWSWLVGERVVIAVAAGLSAGRETGSVTVARYEMPMTTRLDRGQVDGETYLRFGFAFGR